MAKRTKTDRILGQLRMKPVPTGNKFELPNHSGDHSRGLVRTAPERDNAIVNKAYVDLKADGVDPDHTHSKLVSSDGLIDPSLSVDSNGDVLLTYDLDVNKGQSAEKFADADFEAVGTGSWALSGTGGTKSKETGTRTGGTGVQIMKVTVAASNTYIAQTRAVAGRTYIMSGWVRANAAGTALLYVTLGTGLINLAVTTEWQYFTYQRVVSGNATSYLGGAAALDWIEWDDVSLVEVLTTALKVDTVNTRVGVGTGVPDSTLEVDGTLHSTGIGTFDSNITVAGTAQLGNTTIGSGAAGVDYTLTFNGETNDLVMTWREDEDDLQLDKDFRITKNLPTFFLEDDGGNITEMQNGNTQFVFDVDPSNTIASSDIVFKLDGSEVFRVLQGGNFGINTISPDTKLQVVGDTKFGDDNTNYVTTDTAGSMVFVGSAGLPYAEIYAADVADEITITTAGKVNKVQITSFAVDGVSNNATPDHTNDHITITKAGIYKVNLSMHIKTTAGGGSHVVGYSVYKNNGATEFANLHGQRQLSGGGTDEGSTALSGLIDLAVNDTIEVWIWDMTGTDNVVIDDINLSLFQLGG